MEMLEAVLEGKNLSFREAYRTFRDIFSENHIRVAGFLTALEAKGYTAEEIAGFAKAMKEFAVSIDAGDVCDVVGTGGDRAMTINVSTASSIVLSLYRKVAKHGNRSVTSRSGSADFLEMAGVEISLSPEKLVMLIEKTNFGFIFAPLYHPKMKEVMPVRKALGIRTVFNILGPLLNPANPSTMLVGVSSESIANKVAAALKYLGVKNAVVVHGYPYDEVNPSGTSLVMEVRNGRSERYTVTPEYFGLRRVKVIPCLSPAESLSRVCRVFEGKGSEEDRAFITLNASMALYSAGFDDFHECREMVENVFDGTAMKKLEEIAWVSKSLKG